MKAVTLRKAFHVLIWEASLGINDQLAPFKKHIGHSNSLFQETARVVAQIEDKHFNVLLSEILQGFLELLFGGFVKTPQFDIANIILEFCPADTLDLDDCAADGEIFWFSKTLTENADSHCGAFRTAEFLYGIDQ